MRRILRSIYYFLPVQLFLLQFRKYQLLLVFWFVLLFTVTGHFAAHFGASYLFLAPEYMGKINFLSMYLLGSALCVFVMMWNITTFIIHSKRLPYLGGSRHAFLIYTFNNAIVPIVFLVVYSIVSVHTSLIEEHATGKEIAMLQLGFYLGFLTIFLISFSYFFRVSRDFFKNTFALIASPVQTFKNIIPSDGLDLQHDIVPALYYIGMGGKIVRIEEVGRLQPRIMKTVVSRHHRNVIFATFIAYLALLIMGVYIDNPYFRIPAGAGFLLLFAIILGLVGAFKYFLRSWETIGWIGFLVLVSVAVKYQVVDLRSIAYGLDYHVDREQVYHYNTLRSLFSPVRYQADKQTEIGRLEKWKTLVAPDSSKPPLVVICVSGGGLRSAYWTFRALQYADSLSGHNLFRHTVLITGASGGMIGATYWRNVHDAIDRGIIKTPYDHKYQDNIGKDLLNAIVFSFASIDMISPFNKISTAGHHYTADRGYAMEHQMAANSEGLLDHPISYYSFREEAGKTPMTIINSTIVNDGRKLMICTQPVGYLTQPEYTQISPTPTIDAVDYQEFFPEQNTADLRLTSALRMNATFPYILPVVRMPSRPRMNMMDAGLRDNFGVELSVRYLHVLRKWLEKRAGNVIFLQIRDTRENDVSGNTDQTSLGSMLFDPLFVIQNKWEAFQSYQQTYIRDFAPAFLNDRLHCITLQYIPREFEKVAALNFHLTQKEKEDLYESIDHPYNQAEVDRLVKLLNTPPAR